MPAPPFVLAALLALPSGPSQADPGDFAVFEALPEAASQGIQTEVAIVSRDLRQYRRWVQRHRQTLALGRVGQAFYNSGAQSDVFGFDFLTELSRIHDLAAPSGGAVPAGIVAFSYAEGLGVMGLVRVEAGFLDRLTQAPGVDPPFTTKTTGDGVEITLGENTLYGALGEDGWFRLAPKVEMLLDVRAEEPLLAGKLKEWVVDNELVFFVRGQGLVLTTIARLVDDPTYSGMLISLTGAAIGWKTDGDKTVSTRLMVELPQLERLGPIARRADLDNSLAPLWGKDASAFVSASIPPAAVNALPTMAEGLAAASSIEIPQGVKESLDRLEGRVSFASFGAPGDWALGITFEDSEAAAAMVPGLQGWLLELAKSGGSEVNYALEDVLGGAGKVLHLRADAGLQGLRVASFGQQLVVVGQRSRFEWLVAGEGEAGAENRGTVAGPVTPMIKEALERPAMLLGYSVLGVDGGVLEWVAWAVGGLQGAWKTQEENYPQFAFVGRLLQRLPTLLAMEGFGLSMAYDVAVSLDLDQTVVVLEMLMSEL